MLSGAGVAPVNRSGSRVSSQSHFLEQAQKLVRLGVAGPARLFQDFAHPAERRCRFVLPPEPFLDRRQEVEIVWLGA